MPTRCSKPPSNFSLGVFALPACALRAIGAFDDTAHDRQAQARATFGDGQSPEPVEHAFDELVWHAVTVVDDLEQHALGVGVPAPLRPAHVALARRQRNRD